MKQTLINNGFPNYIVDEQIKRKLKLLANKINTAYIKNIDS